MAKGTKVLWSPPKEDPSHRRQLKKHRCPCCGDWHECARESFGWDCDRAEESDIECFRGCYDARLAGVEDLNKVAKALGLKEKP